MAKYSSTQVLKYVRGRVLKYPSNTGEVPKYSSTNGEALSTRKESAAVLVFLNHVFRRIPDSGYVSFEQAAYVLDELLGLGNVSVP